MPKKGVQKNNECKRLFSLSSEVNLPARLLYKHLSGVLLTLSGGRPSDFQRDALKGRSLNQGNELLWRWLSVSLGSSSFWRNSLKLYVFVLWKRFRPNMCNNILFEKNKLKPPCSGYFQVLFTQQSPFILFTLKTVEIKKVAEYFCGFITNWSIFFF